MLMLCCCLLCKWLHWSWLWLNFDRSQLQLRQHLHQNCRASQRWYHATATRAQPAVMTSETSFDFPTVPHLVICAQRQVAPPWPDCTKESGAKMWYTTEIGDSNELALYLAAIGSREAVRRGCIQTVMRLTNPGSKAWEPTSSTSSNVANR
jgi:hypothetical protein